MEIQLSSLLFTFALAAAIVAASLYKNTRTDQQHSVSVTSSRPNENPVLVLGLPRSGSVAVHNFFTCNGLRSSNYCCSSSTSTSKDQKTGFPCGAQETICGACVYDNFKHSRHPFAGCGDYQVYSQFDVETGDPYAWFLPQHFTLPALDEAYPNSTWILNRRNSSKQWATNVLHWYSVSNRLMNSFGIEYNTGDSKLATKNRYPTTDSVKLAFDVYNTVARTENVTEHERRLRELQTVYEAHLQKVRAFAQDSSHRLIEINVDDAVHAGKALASSFPTTRDECFKFDAAALDNDWKDFSLKL
jgi:hypothetical protein